MPGLQFLGSKHMNAHEHVHTHTQLDHTKTLLKDRVGKNLQNWFQLNCQSYIDKDFCLLLNTTWKLQLSLINTSLHRTCLRYSSVSHSVQLSCLIQQSWHALNPFNKQCHQWDAKSKLSLL